MLLADDLIERPRSNTVGQRSIRRRLFGGAGGNLLIGEKIGPVTADFGNNSCQIPFAPDYIRKMQQRGSVGKKRHSAKC